MLKILEDIFSLEIQPVLKVTETVVYCIVETLAEAYLELCHTVRSARNFTFPRYHNGRIFVIPKLRGKSAVRVLISPALRFMTYMLIFFKFVQAVTGQKCRLHTIAGQSDHLHSLP